MDEESRGDRNHVKAWRLHRGLTQEQLADAIGTTKAVISLMENEKRPLSAKWLRRIADVLDTTPGHILDHDPNDLPADIFDIWSHIGKRDRAQAARILSTFTKSGTDD